MSDELERLHKREARVKIFVTLMFVGAGVMFIALGVEIVNLIY